MSKRITVVGSTKENGELKRLSTSICYNKIESSGILTEQKTGQTPREMSGVSDGSEHETKGGWAR